MRLKRTHTVTAMPMGMMNQPMRDAGTNAKKRKPSRYPISQRAKPQRSPSLRSCIFIAVSVVRGYFDEESFLSREIASCTVVMNWAGKIIVEFFSIDISHGLERTKLKGDGVCG